MSHRDKLTYTLRRKGGKKWGKGRKGEKTRDGKGQGKKREEECEGRSWWWFAVQVTCYSTWLSEQILNNGQWCVGDVVYLDEICRASNMSADTLHSLLDFMYTGRAYRPSQLTILTKSTNYTDQVN